MKRSPLKRRKRLERKRRIAEGRPPKRRGRWQRRSKEDLDAQRRKIYGGPTGDHDNFVRLAGCALALGNPLDPDLGFEHFVAKALASDECYGPVTAHHYPLVSQGGTWRDQAPLCRAHHTGWSGGNGTAFPFHQGAETFARRYPWIDLPAIAGRLVQSHYPEGIPGNE